MLDTQKSPISVPSISYIGCVIRGTKSTYEIVKELSARAGGEADLYLCKRIESTVDELLVAKIYREIPININDRKRIIDFLINIDLATTNIMPLIDYGTVDNRHFDIYPYFSDGDLTQHGAFTFEQLKKEIIPSLNETLKITHQAGIIHRDMDHLEMIINADKSISDIAQTLLDTVYLNGAHDNISFILIKKV